MVQIFIFKHNTGLRPIYSDQIDTREHPANSKYFCENFDVELAKPGLVMPGHPFKLLEIDKLRRVLSFSGLDSTFHKRQLQRVGCFKEQ